MATASRSASTVGEIAPTCEFYTFDAKYKDESSKLYIPAHITERQIETVRRNALRVYRALAAAAWPAWTFCHPCGWGGRVQRAEFHPGFTSISMYPKLFDYEGVRYPELLDRLISFAWEERHG